MQCALFKVLLFSFFLCCFTVFLTSSCFAVSVSITNFSSSINTDPFTLTASISGAATGTNYLRVDVYKEGTTNYFSETFNNADWYSGSDGKQYLPINIVSGTPWIGTVQGRISNPTTADYDGTGSYKMRIRRYTSSGGLGSEDANISAVSITVAIPTFTPVPTVTPTLKPTSTLVPTQTSVKSSPTPTVMPTTNVVKISPTSVATSSGKITPVQHATSSGVLGFRSRVEAPSPRLVPSSAPVAVKVLGVSENNNGSIFVIAGGLILLLACGILAYYQRERFGQL